MHLWHSLVAIHRNDKLFVRIGFGQTVPYKLHCLNRIHAVKEIAENPDLVEHRLFKQQVFATGAGGQNIDRGEYPAIRQFTVELQLHVTGSFELFEDHVIHFGTGIG